MRCDAFTERLGAYIDDDLFLPERVSMDAHLAACEDCRNLQATYGATTELLALHARAESAALEVPPVTEEPDHANLMETYEETLHIGEAVFRAEMPETLKQQMEARLFEALRAELA